MMAEMVDKSTKAKLKKLAKSLPGGNGWFHDDGYEPFLTIAIHLSHGGMSFDDIEELLTKTYNAVRSEYGD